jgi:hypothetical protein
MELDIDLDVLRQSTREQLCLLVWCEASSMRQACQERVQIRGYIRGERQTHQFRQMIGSERWTKALMTKLLEFLLGWCAGVALDDKVPLLC